MSEMKPTIKSERIEFLDALRGFALLGILVANLYSFIGYNTMQPEEIIALPFLDTAVLFFIDWFVEGKFYSIFSILFGVGFALQASRFKSADQNFTSFWFRRMVVLLIIGLLHMYFVWNGDILTLYSLLGMVLPLFITMSNRTMLRLIIVLLILPIVMYFLFYLTPDASFWGMLSRVSMEVRSGWGLADKTLLELRTSSVPLEVMQINIINSIPRAMSYLTTGRYFHVLGLFLIGIILARTWLPRLIQKEVTFSKGAIWLGIFGFVMSLPYAILKGKMGSSFALDEMGIMLVIVYNVGSTTFALGITMVLLNFWVNGRFRKIFGNFAILGRMALSNYIFQNVTAVILFFGYGFALMGEVPFSTLPLFAFGILLSQWIFSKVWLSKFKQGPLESIWRKLSYKSSKK